MTNILTISYTLNRHGTLTSRSLTIPPTPEAIQQTDRAYRELCQEIDDLIERESGV